jgi:hypothetical protein
VLHVPFIVQRAGQVVREDIVGQESGEALLRWTLFEGM